MARMTRAQRQWQPGQTKKPASIKIMFASTVLSLEALVAFFATLATFGMNFTAGLGIKIAIWGLGIGLAVAFAVAPAFLKRSWGYTVGWILQVLLILGGLVLTPMFFIGVCFACAYWYAVNTGERLDKENAQRAREQQEWERKNPH